MKKITHSLFCLFIITCSYFETKAQSNPVIALIQDHLIENPKYSFETSDLEGLIINNTVFTEHSGITHVYVNQSYNGIPLFNAISSVALKNNKVVYYANNFLSNIASKINTTTPVKTPQNAIHKIATYFELGTPENLEVLSETNNTYTFSNANISKKPISVKLGYFLDDEILKLSWDILVYTKDNQHWLSIKIDASNNTILNVDDLLLKCTFGHNHSKTIKPQGFITLTKQSNSILVDGSVYNVFALPAESPNHGPLQIVSNPANPNASPFGWHDVDGVAGADFTITRGNNVWAQEDFDGNDGIGFSPDGGPALNFNFPLNTSQPPQNYQDVSVTNLFYTNNMMHDIWYQYGFTESAGNFQDNNYGNGGAQNDFVLADAQDGSGTNNATFGTPPDGFNPVMSMFLWTPSGPLADPLTINNGPLAGDYSGVAASFGSQLTTTPITSNLALLVDLIPDTSDACNPVINASDLNGNIVVIRRGGCEFGRKVLTAENAGALAVIMVNNEAGNPIVMGPGADGGSVTIPSVMVSQTDGEAIISALQNGEVLSATLVNNGPFNIDGDFDNGIIAHEFGHGISNRLTGGPSSVNCLFNDEQMGEGWSDWFGLMITMKSTDVGATRRGIGTFAVSQPITGNGIRPAPYSTDFTINGFTYADSNDTANISQPHGVGFVWATMLWDLTWAYIDKYGFDPDLYNGTGGNNRVMRLVLDGLKLQECNPGFVNGRDALLATDTAINNGEDQCLIWEVFANRGLGFNASQGLSASRTDQVEDFTMPPNTDLSLANCTTLSTSEFLSTPQINIYPNPSSNAINIETSKSLGDVEISLIDLNGRIVVNLKRNITRVLKISMEKLKPGLYVLNIKGDAINLNKKIIKN